MGLQLFKVPLSSFSCSRVQTLDSKLTTYLAEAPLSRRIRVAESNLSLEWHTTYTRKSSRNRKAGKSDLTTYLVLSWTPSRDGGDCVILVTYALFGRSERRGQGTLACEVAIASPETD